MRRLAFLLILVAAALCAAGGAVVRLPPPSCRSSSGRGCSPPIPNSSSASTAANSSGAMARACRSTTARAKSRSRNGWRIPMSPTCWRCPIRQARKRRRRPVNIDPGRARNAAFFDKVYGNCRAGEVEKNLGTVAWLPKQDEAAAAVQQGQWRGARARRGERRARRAAGLVRRLPLPVGRHL